MLELHGPRLKRLYEAWEERRRGREFPSRADFSPLDLTYILGNVSLLDVAYAPLRFRFRLHASHLSARFGFEMTNKSVDEMPIVSHGRMARAHYTEVIEKRAPVAHARDNLFIDCSQKRECEGLVLPLARDGTTIDMLLSALVWNDDGGE
jgi:hypothetical protein